VTSLLIGNGIRNMLPESANIDNPSNPAPQYVALQTEYNHRVSMTVKLISDAFYFKFQSICALAAALSYGNAGWKERLRP
jgi:hypothetical protein